MNPEKRVRNLEAFDRVMSGESVRAVGSDWGISQSRLYEVVRDQLRKRGFQGQYGRWLRDARRRYAAGELREPPPEFDWDHCKHGHEYTPENTGYRTNPSTGNRDRVCLACKQLINFRYNERYWAKRRAARHIPDTW